MYVIQLHMITTVCNGWTDYSAWHMAASKKYSELLVPEVRKQQMHHMCILWAHSS